MIDIKFDLEKSDYLKHRSELMKTLEIPKLSDATETLGAPLAKIVFETCDDALKVDFGLEPPLKGPLGDLWVSPSDMLVGKVALKPPYTRKHIQALTHEGIMSIGIGIEKKFLNEAEMNKETALANQKKDLLHGFEDNIKAEIKDVEARERAACQRELEKLSQEFEQRLVDRLDDMENSLRMEYKKMSESQETTLQKQWERRLAREVQITTKRLTEEFVEESMRQEEIMTKYFKNELLKKDIEKQFDMEQLKTQYQKNVDQLKHNLECKNIANMMYILCMERRKCCDEKETIRKYYDDEIAQLNQSITQKETKISTLTTKVTEQMKQVNLREKCIVTVIREFQKFINFALRSAPTQAEFLLSMEKMLLFELTEVVAKADESKLVPCDDTMLWPSTDWSVPGTTFPGLVIEDDHNCFHELPVPFKEGEGFLPAFKFKNKLYVREDFRNMINKGIEITRSNELWNEDIQILMDTLKKTASGEHVELETRRSTQTSILNRKLDRKSSKKSLKGQVQNSSIKFKLNRNEPEEPEKNKKVSLDENTFSMSLRKLGLPTEKSALRIHDDYLPPTDFANIGKTEHMSKLLATKSSLEILIKKGSVRYLGTKTAEEIEEKEDTPSMYKPETSDLGYKSCETNSFLNDAQPFSTGSKSDVSFKIGLKDKEPGRSLFENKTNLSIQSVPVELVLDTHDSIILRKASLTKDIDDFQIEPKDSVEVKKDSLVDLKRKPSKLVTAKNSVEMLRESRLAVTDTSVCATRGRLSRSRNSFTSKDTCCESKCSKPKESIETLSGATKKSTKVSHVEVPTKQDDQNKSIVSFHPIPTIFEDGKLSDTKLLGNKLYTTAKKPVKAKPKKIVDKFIKLPRKVAVLGDRDAKEYLQNENEFTADRIHSFISLIKDHPSLIRTFTACRR